MTTPSHGHLDAVTNSTLVYQKGESKIYAIGSGEDAQYVVAVQGLWVDRVFAEQQDAVDYVTPNEKPSIKHTLISEVKQGDVVRILVVKDSMSQFEERVVDSVRLSKNEDSYRIDFGEGEHWDGGLTHRVMVIGSDPYPEHTKQSRVLDEAQIIGAFIDSSGYILAEYLDDYHLTPVAGSIEQILAKYLGIDLAKIEVEKRAMLDEMRSR